MELPPFELERWLDEYEPQADLMLAESGVRSLPVDRFDLDVGELGYVIPTDGDPQFRADIAERYGRSADEVVLTCGTQEADYLTFMALLEEGDHTVVVSPTYQSLKSVPDSIGSVTELRTEPPEWDLSVDAVADAMREETRLVVLTNPSNPTGKYLGSETMRALYDLAADNDAYLLVDEVYRMLADDPHPPAAALGPRAISAAGVSKSYGLAGARLGWVVAHPELADAVRKWKDYTTISPPMLGQHVAKQALGEQEDEILRENREHARRNRERVAAFVEEYDLEWFEPVGVNAFPTVPDGFESGKEFCRSVFEAESVVLAPGDVFGYPDRFRLGFGLHTDELEEGLERIGRHVERVRDESL
ncbi:aminotransferase class I/II-fold pyridoxal phosphate-dependent enzyme [Haloprofundus sp. MHR1]|uniref:aminotransferase class I/II-fold pyridoxal phosphate-dependent enzyme n=1 Tax=Haloprofundus sp. MHR1 TaxID=2572921 RepID=UPI0010BEF0B1|nr:aminotransferase class I/II-fold pyridoxal phosphate-dependent enzyme [Haloprofundus sp. MHR1]QCJ48184.1 aminotransferase class I/II-fold pyridoxal phosphate-dependent enzyme [Haloprofundus sp. MHR1]